MINFLIAFVALAVSVSHQSPAITQFAEDLYPDNEVDLIIITDRSRSIGTERYFQSTKLVR